MSEKSEAKKFPKVLLLGNGINICNGSQSWSEFLSSIRDEKSDLEIGKLKSPMPLQAILISNNKIGEKLKEQSKRLMPTKELKCENFPVNQILSLGFDNILTTNYTYELEQASLGNKALSENEIKKLSSHSAGYKADKKYTMYSYNKISYEGKEEKIWHIHGEARKYSSMVLGHDYYGRVLKKIIEYVENRGNVYYMKQREGKEVPLNSWIDAFIMGDVYVLRLTFDFSEIDLWWLLNRKFNERSEHGKVYFYEPKKESEKEKIQLLRVLGAEIRDMGIEMKDKDEKEAAVYEGFYRAAYCSMKHEFFDADVAV